MTTSEERCKESRSPCRPRCTPARASAIRIGIRAARGRGRAGFASFETPDVSDLHEPALHDGAEHQQPHRSAPRLLRPGLHRQGVPRRQPDGAQGLDLAQPGDVIVVDAGASPMNAVLGDLISTKARHRGIGGFVVDGLIRDLPAILELGDFPVFARGITPIGPLHRGPGEINYPICAGGIVVHPGDIVMGDQNGVVIVPREIAADLLRAAARAHRCRGRLHRRRGSRRVLEPVGRHDARSERPHPRRLKCRLPTVDRRRWCWEGSRTRSPSPAASRARAWPSTPWGAWTRPCATRARARRSTGSRWAIPSRSSGAGCSRMPRTAPSCCRVTTTPSRWLRATGPSSFRG